ncbi:hypothetical protein FJQ54_16850 [Sandaracinobacter neustonicus]|uniref:Uncharacterized protein n=1 Tax=Sandaracinobacter neustonicus TaxID=1715348 RepID=A0A501XEI8_9SPHN|nr:hypothetical protein [Sandaracinobacter neustonicus]TPE58714.1 hypothetical protein FJQ54_16850 [Sandaracinobacter neustonicus]
MRILVAALGAGLLLSAPAGAQVPDKLIGCSAEPDDAKRLACYDSVVKAISADARRVSEAREAEAAKAKQAAAAAAAAAATAAAVQAEETRKASFGKADSAAEVKSVDASISEILRDASGKPVFILDNGQMWRQADGFNLPNAKVGTKVAVKRGAMGSYRLQPENSNRSVQVIRMR